VSHLPVAGVEGDDTVGGVCFGGQGVDDLLGDKELDESLLEDVPSPRSETVHLVLARDPVDSGLGTDRPPALLRVERQQQRQNRTRFGVEGGGAPGNGGYAAF
jgi:hypothetical protein